jgi:hypothetical protein
VSDLRVNGGEQAKGAQQGIDPISADRIDDLVGSLSEAEKKVLATQIAIEIPQAEAKERIVTEAIKSAPAAAHNWRRGFVRNAYSLAKSYRETVT